MSKSHQGRGLNNTDTNHSLDDSTGTDSSGSASTAPADDHHGGRHGADDGTNDRAGGPPADKGPMGLGDVFSFALTNGNVTGASMLTSGGSTINLAIGAGTGINLAVQDGNILASRTDASGMDTLTFSDTDGDSFYEIVANSHVFTTAPEVNMLGFVNRSQVTAVIDNTTVSEVSKTLRDGTAKDLLSDTVTSDSTTWSVQNGLLVATHTNSDGVNKWEVYRDGNADHLYTEVAQGHGDLIDLVGVVTATDAIAGSL